MFLFSVCFVLFAVLYLLDPSTHVWERDMLHFFIRILLCFTYTCEYSCLVAVIAVSSQFFHTSLVRAFSFF